MQQQLHQYHSQGFDTVRAGYPGLRRVASIPRTYYNSPHAPQREPPSNLVNPAPYENWRESGATPSPLYEENIFSAPQMQMPQVHFPTAQANQWRDVRRVQSHSDLIGSRGANLKKSSEYGLHNPVPTFNHDPMGPTSYGQILGYGRFSPPLESSIYSMQHSATQQLSSFEHQNNQMQHPSGILPWGLHNDGGNRG